MLDKMQSLEDKIENKLKEIDKMFAVAPETNLTTNPTSAPSNSPLVNSALT